MKINWKVRLVNKTFWLTFIPALLLLAQIVAGWFDISFAADLVEQEAIKFINALFAVLMILGVVTDPTTKGTSDSKQARTYKKPREDVE
ncbi:holin, phage phi LC3 family [Oceanobacillus limi]|uniref:Holin, phage phi LC3 family n=1 Tax=Oceanobacillus limi TaxID=930131 RepID=A0A1I0HL27_9BACI|nr:phage holin [Oceanobacillus limi]SET84432.1 holin, phage phi LC3 family [Oceanobacillus limi]